MWRNIALLPVKELISMVGPERVIENKSVSHGFQSRMMLVGHSPIFSFWLKVGYQAYTKICTHLWLYVIIAHTRYRMGTNIQGRILRGGGGGGGGGGRGRVFNIK